MIANEDYMAIAELDLEPIKVKLMHEASGEGWSLEYVNAVEFEYRRFLYLMKKFPNEQTAPLFDVDIFWHYHILDTMKYAVDCERIFGYFLHHFPYIGLRGEDDEQAHHRVGERMRELYEATFGESYVRAPQDEVEQQAAFSGAAAATAFSGAAVNTARAGATARTAFSGAASKTAFSGAAANTAFSGSASKTAFSGAATKTAFSGATRTAFSGAAATTAFSGAAVKAASSVTAAKTAFSGAASATAFSGAATKVAFSGAAAKVAFSGAAAKPAFSGAAGKVAFSGATANTAFSGAARVAKQAEPPIERLASPSPTHNDVHAFYTLRPRLSNAT